MAPMVRLRGLIFLCLLHLCVQGIQGDVNTAVLAKITQYFYDNVQPKTKREPITDAQYAIAIRVPLGQCTPKSFDIQTVFSKSDAANVQDKLNKAEKCLLNEGDECTSLGNVIATRPDMKTKEHSEHILLYPPTGETESPMDRLLAKAGQDTCVVFYSYNSPCVKTCIKGENNILEGLSNWINKNKFGDNAFVFQEIWPKENRKILKEEFPKINEKVPLYRCKRTNNVMECQKCVDNNNNVDDFCLPAKK
ncbi:hypothetical protein R3I93_003926 [Phoxinus phoxinus]|uniref:Uncharacterized protein n=1 Tax=Phoxinus phoxinus TaxID=58324 RepID=A0AAN9DC02_9TELE